MNSLAIGGILYEIGYFDDDELDDDLGDLLDDDADLPDLDEDADLDELL